MTQCGLCGGWLGVGGVGWFGVVGGRGVGAGRGG